VLVVLDVKILDIGKNLLWILRGMPSTWYG